MPVFLSFFNTKNEIPKFCYNTLAISLAAQIGILPLCLYYFGTFPVYFLFANFLIVPLLSILFYDVLLMFITALIGFLFPPLNSAINVVPTFVFKVCAKWITLVVDFFENLPYSTIDNINISLFTVFILLLSTFLIWLYLKIRTSKVIICILLCCLIIQAESLFDRFRNRNTVSFINNFGASSLSYQKDLKVASFEKLNKNETLYLGDKVFYILSENIWHDKKQKTTKPTVNYLLLETSDIISVAALTDVFKIEKIILGNRIPRQTVNRLIVECEKLRIPYYDLYSKGSLTINF